MAKDFIVSVDSSCDEFKRVLEQKDIECIPMAFYKDGMEKFDDFTSNADYVAFYQSLKKGAMPTTSPIDAIDFGRYFTKKLEGNDKDLIHISLSSGLSASYENAIQAAAVVMKKFPGRKIEIVDSLASSRTLFMLADLALQARFNGVGAEDCAKNLRSVAEHTHQGAVVDDMGYVKRVGARITGSDAFFQSLSGGQKPIIYTNQRGELRITDKVANLKAGLVYMFEFMKKTAINIERQTIYISHANAVENAEVLRDMILREFSQARVNIGWIGPIIGAHTGEGAVAICFVGKEK